jgi:chaperonin GroEL
MKLKEVSTEVLGKAEKIKITKETTTLIGGEGHKENIEERLKQIDYEIEKTTNNDDREKLNERRAKLSSGVAVIRVGAHSELEMKQKKQVFEDSLNSTRAAQEGGYVPGGGVALLRASQKLKDLTLPGEEKIGAEITIKACAAPFKQIVENSGKDSALLLEEILKKKSDFGFNALTEQIENLITSQIIDPAKVVKNCLTYATSAAGVVLISEALVTEVQEEG